jgi:NAD(P)-dependent dehydrogenase (short-subunit alcohol dehydrogenase family)
MSVVVITGCSSGIGFESALAFARRGDRVHACVRDMDRSEHLKALAREEGLDLHFNLLDVTKAETFPDFVAGVIEQSEKIDVLVNNAGILHAGAWEDLSEAQARSVMETNFFGPLLLTRALLPRMRARGKGYIIMISSLSGIAGLAGDVAYSASKSALEGATEALRHEVDRWGIRLALVQGGQYATNIFSANGSESDSDLLPPNYPGDSAYRDLVEFKLRQAAEGRSEALHPQIVAKLLLQIADSDGSTLRWPADDLARHVLSTMHGQSDADRDTFLRMAGGSDWWSSGKGTPDSTQE